MRIDSFLFGNKIIRIESEYISKAATNFLRLGLNASIDSDGKICVPLYRVPKYVNALRGMEYTVSEIKGLVGYISVFLSKKGLLIGSLLAAFCYIFSSLFVWDVRVSGNENLPLSVVEEELSRSGLFVGAPWSSLSLNKVEAEVLSKSEAIGWININKRGKVAYVTVKERSENSSEKESVAYSNIVASRDCVIEEITVISGVACVKAGDTVRRGELLISGVIPSESGGGFVRAEGVIVGSYSEEISVEVQRNERVKSYGEEELSSVNINILKLSINIFKKYGKNDKEYVIINDVKECTVLGRYRIPLGIYKTYVAEVSESEASYTDGELMEIASSRLAKKRIAALSNSELLRLRSQGAFTASGYKMTTLASVLAEVGEERSFSE